MLYFVPQQYLVSVLIDEIILAYSLRPASTEFRQAQMYTYLPKLRRLIVPGGGRVAMARPDFGISVNP